ncbi:ArsR/SmtB family transcription factor [Ruania halotolerans]|uniref:ArsR/SmtB family transcription factor n=1 Tax=Ruania halotolerans TaxID=2897773 RepID=UPI001E51BF56|nr:helix-turn-helix domain-containing protein [Ruania halotolerans]UFU05564.1 helix-turn-helix domain-containing protein [Ruania halotolerans]
MNDRDRLAALEGRVSELEAQLQAMTEPVPDVSVPDSEIFWALEGLRARVDEPGAVLLAGRVRLPDGRDAQWQEASVTDELLGGEWAESADMLSALGHPVRLRLLQRVLAGATTVPQLTETDGVGTSGQVYHHLRQLTSAGWLRSLGSGRYEVPVARVVPLLAVIMGARR